MSPSRSLPILLLFVVASLVASPTAAGAPNTWIGGTAGDWSDPTNWAAGVPGPSDDVTIDTHEVEVAVGTTARARSISLGQDATLHIDSGAHLVMGDAGNAAAVDIVLDGSSGATLSLDGDMAAHDHQVGIQGIGPAMDRVQVGTTDPFTPDTTTIDLVDVAVVADAVDLPTSIAQLDIRSISDEATWTGDSLSGGAAATIGLDGALSALVLQATSTLEPDLDLAEGRLRVGQSVLTAPGDVRVGSTARIQVARTSTVNGRLLVGGQLRVDAGAALVLLTDAAPLPAYPSTSPVVTAGSRFDATPL